MALNVPTVKSNPDFEYLLWVGCAGSYDPRAQNVTKAIAKILTNAKINYAVLATEEKCTGDPARRLGEEILFQQCAQANVDTLRRYGVRKIVTHCPHCFNSLKNEYPQFGGEFQVQHHSQLLASLVGSGKLLQPTRKGQSITLHDPCYLSRVNEEVTAQRVVVKRSGHELQEMPRWGKDTFCCGAGGGSFWGDEKNAEQRISQVRAKEVLGTEATILATACPFCLNMMSEAMGGVQEKQKDIKVMDIAELFSVLFQNKLDQ